MEGFTNKQIAEKTALTPRMIQFFTQEGVVTPDIDKGEGRGRVRRYSEKNLFEFALISELSIYGIKIASIRYIINGLGITKRDDFFEILTIVKPVLTLKIREGKLDFGEVAPELWMSVLENNSISNDINRIFERNVSVLMIDLFQLYQRKCLGVIPEDVHRNVDSHEHDEVKKLFGEIISIAEQKKVNIEDLFLQVIKKTRKGEIGKGD